MSAPWWHHVLEMTEGHTLSPLEDVCQTAVFTGLGHWCGRWRWRWWIDINIEPVPMRAQFGFLLIRDQCGSIISPDDQLLLGEIFEAGSSDDSLLELGDGGCSINVHIELGSDGAIEGNLAIAATGVIWLLDSFHREAQRRPRCFQR